MADKHLDPEDPFTLNGHAIPLTAEEADEHMIEMTDALVQEFAMLGWPPAMILGMFKKSFYRMPHMIFQAKGELYVQSRIDRFFGVSI